MLVPNRQWGGEGLLGCVFGLASIIWKNNLPPPALTLKRYRFGLLHRIPPPPSDRSLGEQDPSEYEEQALFVPADLNQQQGIESVQREVYDSRTHSHGQPRHSGPNNDQTDYGDERSQDERNPLHPTPTSRLEFSRTESLSTNAVTAPGTHSFMNGDSTPQS